MNCQPLQLYIGITWEWSCDLHFYLRFGKRDSAGSMKHKINFVWPYGIHNYSSYALYLFHFSRYGLCMLHWPMHMLMYIHTFKHIYYNYICTKVLTLSMNNYSAYIHIGVSGLNSNTTKTTIIITWNPAVSPDCGPVLSYTVSATNLVDGSVRNPGRLSQRVAEFSNLINGTNYNISVPTIFSIWPTKIHFGQPNFLYIFNGTAINNL